MPQHEFNADEERILNNWYQTNHNIFQSREQMAHIRKADILAKSYINKKNNRSLDFSSPFDKRVLLDCYNYYNSSNNLIMERERLNDLMQISDNIDSNLQKIAKTYDSVINAAVDFVLPLLDNTGTFASPLITILRDATSEQNHRYFSDRNNHELLNKTTENQQQTPEQQITLLQQQLESLPFEASNKAETLQLIETVIDKNNIHFFNSLNQRRQQADQQLAEKRQHLEGKAKLKPSDNYEAHIRNWHTIADATTLFMEVCGKNGVAQQMKCLSANAMKIYEGIHLLSLPAAAGMALSGWGAIAMGTMGLFQSFIQQDNSGLVVIQKTLRTIMKRLNTISTQINQLHREMQQQFIEVRKLLNKLQNTINSGFNKLLNGQQTILHEIRTLQSIISGLVAHNYLLERKIDQNHLQLMLTLRQLNFQDIFNKLAIIANNIANPTNLQTHYKLYLNELAAIASTHACAKLLTHSNVEISFSHNNEIIDPSFHIKQLAEKLNDPILNDPPNPRVWSLVVNTIIHLLIKLDEEEILLDDNDKNRLLEVIVKGRIILQIAQSIGNKEFLQLILNEYLLSVQNLTLLVQDAYKEFQKTYQQSLRQRLLKSTSEQLTALTSSVPLEFNPQYHHKKLYSENDIARHHESCYQDYLQKSLMKLRNFRASIESEQLTGNILIAVDQEKPQFLPVTNMRLLKNLHNESLSIYIDADEYIFPEWIYKAETLGIGHVEYSYKLCTKKLITYIQFVFEDSAKSPIHLHKILFHNYTLPKQCYEANTRVWLIWHGGRYAAEGSTHRQHYHHKALKNDFEKLVIDAPMPEEVAQLIQQKTMSLKKEAAKYVRKYLSENNTASHILSAFNQCSQLLLMSALFAFPDNNPLNTSGLLNTPKLIKGDHDVLAFLDSYEATQNSLIQQITFTKSNIQILIEKLINTTSAQQISACYPMVREELDILEQFLNLSPQTNSVKRSSEDNDTTKNHKKKKINNRLDKLGLFKCPQPNLSHDTDEISENNSDSIDSVTADYGRKSI